MRCSANGEAAAERAAAWWGGGIRGPARFRDVSWCRCVSSTSLLFEDRTGATQSIVIVALSYCYHVSGSECSRARRQISLPASGRDCLNR